MQRKKKPNQDKTPEPIPAPALYPIEEALLTAFSLDPELQEQPQAGDRKPNILDPDDWLEDKRETVAEPSGHGGPPPATAAAGPTSEADGSGQRLHVPEPSLESIAAHARETGADSVPLRDVELLNLAPWQRRYVVSLRVCGVNSLAAQHARVSNTTVDKYKRENSLFAECCREALKDCIDTVEAATIQSATVGDPTPVYQGGLLVGHVRRKNVKAAELLFKKAGYLEDKPKEQARNQVQVDLVAETALATVVASAMTALYEARLRQPLLDAETGRPVER